MSLRARKNWITAWSRSFGHIGWIYCFPYKYRITIGLRFITWTQLVSLKIVRMLTWVGTILASDLEQRGKIKMLILFCFKWNLCVIFFILFINIWEFILHDHFSQKLHLIDNKTKFLDRAFSVNIVRIGHFKAVFLNVGKYFTRNFRISLNIF